MAKGLTRVEYANRIALQLGFSVVNIEIMNVIPDIVDLAFNELKNYIMDPQPMTLPFSNRIDLKGKKVSNIIYVMRGQTNVSASGLLDIMYVYSRQNMLLGGAYTFSLTDYARSLLLQQNKSAIATDLDFYFDKREEQLYIYAQQLVPTTITIMYTPEYDSTEEIIEPFWQTLLHRLALALSKEVLGRARGKYDLDTSLYKLDADQLLSEASEELAEIRTYLQNNNDLLLPID